jgi:hypothetical protein
MTDIHTSNIPALQSRFRTVQRILYERIHCPKDIKMLTEFKYDKLAESIFEKIESELKTPMDLHNINNRKRLRKDIDNKIENAKKEVSKLEKKKEQLEQCNEFDELAENYFNLLAKMKQEKILSDDEFICIAKKRKFKEIEQELPTGRT